MYTVTFCEGNGTKHIFYGIEEIAVGDNFDTLEKIKKDDVLKYTFPTKAIYQLTGEVENSTFVADNCIFVQVQQG